VVGIDHIGSVHDEIQLAVLMEAARQLPRPGQETFDFAAQGSGSVSGAPVAGMRSQILWDVLTGAYERLGFAQIGDETFMRLVLARIIEPKSKADTVRVLEDIGVAAPSLRTIFRCLDRCVARDYRDAVSRACVAHSTGTGMAAMVMYDVTTLHFEAEKEDALRRVGMSKEHRVDPQVQVELLVDPSGFPLEIHMFEGNKAETKTLIGGLDRVRRTPHRGGHGRRGRREDALREGVNALAGAGFSFIVGFRISKAPYDLVEHFHRHGDYFADAQILEFTRVMGTGKAARPRGWSTSTSSSATSRDNRAINAMVELAEKITTGATPMAKARFLKVTGATRELDQALIDRARQLAGLKVYVTNLPITTMDGQTVIDAYHDLYQVERSFRIAKNGPESTAGLPPPTRSDRSAPHSRVRRSHRRSSPSGRNWRQPEETRPHAAAPADRHHRYRGPHDRHQASTHRRRPTDPREAPAPHGVTNLARVRTDGARIEGIRAPRRRRVVATPGG
jgi:hypothetical protein